MCQTLSVPLALLVSFLTCILDGPSSSFYLPLFLIFTRNSSIAFLSDPLSPPLSFSLILLLSWFVFFLPFSSPLSLLLPSSPSPSSFPSFLSFLLPSFPPFPSLDFLLSLLCFSSVFLPLLLFISFLSTQRSPFFPSLICFLNISYIPLLPSPFP